MSALFTETGGSRSVSDLARAAGVNWSAADREVRRLVAQGIIRRMPAVSRKQGPLFEADPSFPGHLDLRRFILVAAGDAGRMRRAIAPLDPQQLAWIHGPYAETTSFIRPIRLAVITRETRAVRDRLSSVERDLHRPLALDVVTMDEWALRLARREMRVLAIRRATRLWLIGDDDLLRRRERMAATDHVAWKQALANWREEAEWDEDFDPFAVIPGPPLLRT